MHSHFISETNLLEGSQQELKHKASTRNSSKEKEKKQEKKEQIVNLQSVTPLFVCLSRSRAEDARASL